MRRAPGFTLLEMLVVMGVISVLLGLSVGFLGRTDPRRVAESILGAELRAAQQTARAEGVPTEVLVRPGVDNQPGSVQSRLLRPVVTFHMEPRQAYEDEELQPVLLGEDVAGGRFGHARRAPADGKSSLLKWPAPPHLIDLREGFVVRLDLWLDQRSTVTVLRLPPAVELLLDADGKPRARLRLRGSGGDGNVLAVVGSELPLPLRQWLTIDVGCDGRQAWLSIDGIQAGFAVAEGTPVQEADATFEVVPADGTFDGMVDEVRWFVYQLAPPQTLPAQCQIDGTYRFTFDARGEAIERPEVRLGLPEEGS
jgi:prepilin-type N-terminal cleavage/methylation domain-containing protein